MFLIVDLGDPERPLIEHLGFESVSAAEQALMILRTSDQTVVEFANERGEVLCVRRSAVFKAWTSATVPETNDSSIALSDLIARLGPPVYDGAKGVGWRIDRDGRWAAGPSGRVVIWSCSSSATTSEKNMCMADITGSDSAIYWPCKLHQYQP